MSASGAAAEGVRILGAVLTGGRSRRMGRDKSTIQVGGRSLGAIAAAALRGAGADPVLAIGGTAGATWSHDLVDVADDHPGEGPLGGILTALRRPEVRDADVVAVIACDVPGATSKAVAAVIAALVDAPGALAAATVVDGFLQPLHAAWRPAAVDLVSERFAAGERSPRRVLVDLDVVPVGGVERSAVAGVNTPQELAAARRRTGQLASGQTGRMSDSTSVPEISVDELAGRYTDAFVLDVRQPDEYEEGHVPGARLIPLDQLNDRHGEVPKGPEVYVVCKSGGRSAAAVEALNGAGYRAVNVAGGTMAWIEAGNPVVTGTEAS